MTKVPVPFVDVRLQAVESTMIESAFYGSFFHAPEYGKLEFLENALIEVDEAGVIVRVVPEDDPDQERLLGMYLKLGILVTIGEGYYCLPGFVDIHVHAPQWPQAALALDEPLYQWLEERTFPLESMFADVDFARVVYSDLVKQLLARGSTTAMYLGSAHLESSIALAEICSSMGQRALVGKTVMDDPAANPEYYRDASPAQAIADTVTLIKSGTYDVAIRYQSDEDGSVKLYSNGHDALYLLPNTNGEWAEALNTITLAQGENAVVIQNAQRVNVKIDCIRLTYRGGEPTAIRNVAVGQQGEPEAYYDLNGHRLKTLRKGMNIVKGRDGKVRKVLYK